MSTSLITAYEAFRRDFGVERDHSDSFDYYTRAALYDKRREQVKQHNVQRDMGWVAAVNKFADYTDAEFTAMLGHRHSRRARSADSAAVPTGSSLIQSMPAGQLAQAVDWRSNLTSTMVAKDQGGCGSCWAVAAAGALETHAEIGGHAPEVSYEQLVDCVENPKECGGTGGCHGATAELAFEYIAKHGLALKKDYTGYQSGGDGSCRAPSSAAVTAKSFVRLPENEPKPLQAALMQGPVAVSVDASDWMLYGNGVFHGCERDAVINHAVLMMGFGTDASSKMDYWLIRNSWGPDWGEGGYVRMLRHKDSESYCGVDHKPLDGVGCKGGPATLKVCGMCGILSDSAYPTGVGMTAIPSNTPAFVETAKTWLGDEIAAMPSKTPAFVETAKMWLGDVLQKIAAKV